MLFVWHLIYPFVYFCVFLVDPLTDLLLAGKTIAPKGLGREQRRDWVPLRCAGGVMPAWIEEAKRMQ